MASASRLHTCRIAYPTSTTDNFQVANLGTEAGRYQLFSMQGLWGTAAYNSVAQRLKALDAALSLACYKEGLFLDNGNSTAGSNAGNPGAVGLGDSPPEAWYLHASGSRVSSPGNANYKFMNFGLAAFYQKWYANAIACCQANGFNWIHMDDVWTDPSKTHPGQFGGSSFPDEYPNEGAWLAAWQANLTYGQAQCAAAGIKLYINLAGISADKANWKTLVSLADGVFEEGWMRRNTSHTGAMDKSDDGGWGNMLEGLEYAVTNNKTFLAEIPTDSTRTTDSAIPNGGTYTQILKYGLASFLLGVGSSSTPNEMIDICGSPTHDTEAYDSLLATVSVSSIGSPLGPRALVSGTTHLWRRNFTNGIVLVNETSATTYSNIALGATYSGFGVGPTSVVTVSPETGLVLLASSPPVNVQGPDAYTATANTNGTTLDFTLTSAIAVGDTLIVTGAASVASSPFTATITDNATGAGAANIWTTDYTQASTMGDFIAHCVVTRAFNAGDLIRITWSQTASVRVGRLTRWSGILTVSPIDQIGHLVDGTVTLAGATFDAALTDGSDLVYVSEAVSDVTLAAISSAKLAKDVGGAQVDLTQFSDVQAVNGSTSRTLRDSYLVLDGTYKGHTPQARVTFASSQSTRSRIWAGKHGGVSPRRLKGIRVSQLAAPQYEAYTLTVTDPYSLIFKRHDTRRLLVPVLAENGQAIDLTYALQVVFGMRLQGASTLRVLGQMAIVNPTLGAVSYTWQTNDLAVAGAYQGAMRVTWDDGSLETFPNSGFLPLTVLEDVA